MKPEQVFLGHGLQIVETVTHGRRVLSDGVAAGRRAIEADARGVGAMVVDGRPVRARTAGHPWTRPVVMAPRHQVVQAEWRHVVDGRLARRQHHRFHRGEKRHVVRKCDPQPFIGKV